MPAAGAPLVILAGGGAFPALVAAAAEASGRPVLVLALEGVAGPEVSAYLSQTIRRGELGRLFRAMRAFRAEELVIIGTYGSRSLPSWREVDLAGLLVVLANLRMLTKGDDGVLRKVARLIEARGIRIVAPGEVAPALLARAGPYGRHRPDAAALSDIAVGIGASRDLGRRDLGQAVVVCGGAVIGREDVRGTDALIAASGGRSAGPDTRRGVLVKCMKPGQDVRLDVPAIGPDTIRNAARAGLAGVAIEAGRTLVAHEAEVRALADELGLFVHGFEAAADPREAVRGAEAEAAGGEA